jgi:hypothetical protein
MQQQIAAASKWLSAVPGRELSEATILPDRNPILWARHVSVDHVTQNIETYNRIAEHYYGYSSRRSARLPASARCAAAIRDR